MDQKLAELLILMELTRMPLSSKDMLWLNKIIRPVEKGVAEMENVNGSTETNDDRFLPFRMRDVKKQIYTTP